MPTGIARSKFVSPLAKSLGWKLGRLRALFNRKGYYSPYLDEIRGLKICIEEGLDIRPYLDKAGHGPDFLASLNVSLNKGNRPLGAPAGPVPANELVLSQPPSAPPPTLNLPVPQHQGKPLPLIVRLCNMLGGPQHEEKVRAVLEKHQMDLRGYKAEDRILQVFIKEGYSVDGFERRYGPDSSIVSTRPGLEKMSIAELRDYAAELQRALAGKEMTLRNMEARHKRIQDLLEMGKNLIVTEYRALQREDESESEILMKLVRKEAGRPI